MSAAAALPFAPARSPRRPWTPTDRERLIFQWVKFEGHSQSWVADQLEMHQSTVSRTIDRYQRWIARGGPGHDGAPSHDERLRAQRWLTYERNEWILSSALRIAADMERAIDTSKSTIVHAASRPSQETEVRTHHERIDRSALAARYLRLAHRINMDQLRLTEQDPLPPLEPLTWDDLDLPPAADPAPSADEPAICPFQPSAAESSLAESSLAESSSADAPPDAPPPPSAPEPPPMPNPHNSVPTTHSASATAATPSTKTTTPQKTSNPAYAVAINPPETAAAPRRPKPK